MVVCLIGNSRGRRHRLLNLMVRNAAFCIFFIARKHYNLIKLAVEVFDQQ